ncbi:type III-B CRISPR module-associated protein Cmr5 [Thermococcus indicus]|uniref:CRISPR type III-B/RAMP module-associated protein Cmr5 n=2 Tax=Thermococcus indicus TaxID=2586643 RepID=A0A4Y5SNH5_9EURY|nr:type III-B CRISPR module-associated protein Cmr5 [Thermococcus indicus]
MDIKTLDQERAEFAYRSVLEVANLSVKDSKGNDRGSEVGSKYRSYVKSAPVLILTNGLGQALAFYRSKIKPEANIVGPNENTDNQNNSVLYTKLPEWIIKMMTETKTDKTPKFSADRLAYAYLYKHIAEWLGERGLTDGKDPLKAYTEKNALNAVLLTEETIAFLNWLRRFADAMLEEDKESGEGA